MENSHFENLKENGPNPFFVWTKIMVRVNLMATVLCRHGFNSKPKLVYAGEIQNEIIEWKWPSIFQNKRVRYARRADELEL